MTTETDPVRQAVETLSRLVATPRPPRDLRAEAGRPKRTTLRVALAAVLVLAATGAWLALRRSAAPRVPDSPRFVVEHLRVRGRTVEPRVMEVRGAGALVLMVAPPGVASGDPEWTVQVRTALMADGAIAPDGRF